MYIYIFIYIYTFIYIYIFLYLYIYISFFMISADGIFFKTRRASSDVFVATAFDFNNNNVAPWGDATGSHSDHTFERMRMRSKERA